MPQTKITDIRELSLDELKRSLNDLRRESLNLRLQKSTGQLENTGRMKMVRREIARVLTVINEKTKPQPADSE